MSALLARHRSLLSFSLLGTSGILLGLRAMSSNSPKASNTHALSGEAAPYPIQQYQPRHAAWPYKPSDFARQDPTIDTSFYDSPRFVTHIDDNAIAALRAYYAKVLPRRGRILDLCSSWISHYPPEVEASATSSEVHITGVGMNKAELDRNRLLSTRTVLDLNSTPRLESRDLGLESESLQESLDATTCVVSIDYLTEPRGVLSSILQHTRQDGAIHLAISNRCFPTKAVARWLRVNEDERLQMVGDYLWFSGWRDIEIVTVTDGKQQKSEKDASNWLAMLMGGNNDPLWIVRARKTEA
ncbi:MAG: hypothetical protein M1828_002143 [Chrysothrix sp. TS-e1954]|nr:MAG: hypothetical protein M1828_002143 [Chrysothrix sp. TS-e1954]